MFLRPATLDDAEMLWRWRNDPLTRAMAVTTDYIPWDTHIRWLRATLGSADRSLFVGEVNGCPIGSTRIDWDDEPEVTMAVAPEHRMKAYPVKLLAATLPDTPTVIARIKRENTCSQRLVRLLGFALAEDGPLQLWRRHAQTDRCCRIAAEPHLELVPPDDRECDAGSPRGLSIDSTHRATTR